MPDSPLQNFSDFEIDDDGFDCCGPDDDDESISDSSDDERHKDRPTGMKALGFDASQLTNHPSGLPLNGHDYLKQVQEEREKLAAIVSARPPPAPLKTRDSCHPDHENSFLAQKRTSENESCIRRGQFSPSLSNSSDELFSPVKNNEGSPREQLGIEPLDTTISNLLETSSDNLCLNDISMSASEYGAHNKSNCSIMSSSVFREKVKLKSLQPKSSCANCIPNASMSNKFKNLGDREYCSSLLKNFNELRDNIGKHRNKMLDQEKDDKGAADLNALLDIYDDKLEERIKSRLRKPDASLVERALGQMSIGMSPPFEELILMSQRVIHLILEKLAERCELTPNYSTLHADWIYSLMACLQEPIDPDICSTLRTLARFCIARRDLHYRRTIELNQGDSIVDMDCDSAPGSSTGEKSDKKRALTSASSRNNEARDLMDKEEYPACILIICIVHHVFGQTDLK